MRPSNCKHARCIWNWPGRTENIRRSIFSEMYDFYRRRCPLPIAEGSSRVGDLILRVCCFRFRREERRHASLFALRRWRRGTRVVDSTLHKSNSIRVYAYPLETMERKGWKKRRKKRNKERSRGKHTNDRQREQREATFSRVGSTTILDRLPFDDRY